MEISKIKKQKFEREIYNLNEKLLEENTENTEQVQLALKYERELKASSISIKEYLEGEIKIKLEA